MLLHSNLWSLFNQVSKTFLFFKKTNSTKSNYKWSLFDLEVTLGLFERIPGTSQKTCSLSLEKGRCLTNYFLGLQNHCRWCSHEIKRCLLLGRKATINLDSILKSRDITLPTKVHIVKAMGFPAVMYGCESWTIKKIEHWRTDAFELRCWRRLLRVPWTARRLNQSILKEINPEYSLEGLMLKL